MLKILHLALPVLLLIALPANADVREITTQQYDVKSLSLKNGLVQSSVRGIIQDRNGLIWLGTEAGVQIFNGLHLKRLDQLIEGEVDRQIPTLRVNQLLETQNGSILISTRGNGLVKFDQGSRTIQQFTATGFTSKVEDTSTFFQVCQDPQSNLWAASRNGLLQLNQQIGSWKVILPSQDNSRVTDISCQNNQIIARRDSELVRWDKTTTQTEILAINSNADDPDLVVIKQLNSQYTLIGKQDGLFHLSNDFTRLDKIWPADNQAIIEQPDKQLAAVNDILIDSQNTVWLATDHQGLVLLELNSLRVLKQIKSMPDNAFSLSGNHVLRLMKDHSNLMWASIYGVGIDRLFMSQSGIQTYYNHTNNSLDKNDITAITQGPDDTYLWYTTARSGVKKLSLQDMSSIDISKQVLKTYHKYAPGDLPFISDIEVDALNRLWFTTSKGIIWLHLTTLESRFYAVAHNNELGPRVRGRDIFTDRNGVMYITDEGAILRYNPLTDSFTRLTLSDSQLPDAKERMRKIRQHVDGDIYVLGTKNIFRLNNNHLLSAILGPEQISKAFAGRLSSFAIKPDGDFYIGAQGALIEIDMKTPATPKLVVYTGKALADNYFYSIELGSNNDPWLSTNNGIVHFDAQTHNYNHFSLSDGVLVREFNGMASVKRKNGQIIFGGIDGWTMVDPSQISLNDSTPRLTLSSHQIGSQPAKSFLPKTGLKMLFSDHWLQFSFSALDYRSPEENHYSYFLEGFDPDWRSFGNKSEISFTGLPPGKYTLHARAATKRGDWHPQPLSIPLTISPPLYRSTLAYLIYTLIFILIMSAFIWRRYKLSSERAHYVKLVETSEQQMKLALWGSGDSIWDWKILDNEIFRTGIPFLGYPDDQSDGTIESFKALIHPDDLPQFEHELGEVLACHTAEYTAQFRIKNSDGQWHWVSDQGKVVETTAGNKPVRISGAIRDISLIKSHEKALQDLNDVLELKIEERTRQYADKNSQLSDTLGNLKNTQNQLVESEKMASLGNLVAGISHEINTPVGVALTAASHNTIAIERLQALFYDRKLTVKAMEKGLAELKTSNELIESSVTRTAQLIQTFKQVAVDHDHHEWRIIELPYYLIEIVPTFNTQLANTDYTIEVIDSDFFDAECAPGALYQILSQLIINSVDHGFCDLTQGKIIIETELRDDHWILRYSDNGNGMDNESQSMIFEPFYTTKRGKGYAGLGMHLVFNIVSHSLGGTIECISELNQGVTFLIKLPLGKLNLKETNSTDE